MTVRKRRHAQAAARPASVKLEAVAQAVKPPPPEHLPTRLPGKGAFPPSEEEGRDNSSIREAMRWKAGPPKDANWFVPCNILPIPFGLFSTLATDGRY